MQELITITWDMGKGIPLGSFTLRFYQLLFASGFILGYFLMRRFFRKEGLPDELLDKLLTYMVISTIIGARLGHVFFYQWDYYSAHPGDILKVWEGGLASHGAAIAIIIGMYLFSKRETGKSTLYILDKVVVTVALAGCLIRLGNFFNSEIYGHKANSAIETVYTDLPRQAILRYWDEEVKDIRFAFEGEHLDTDSISYPIYSMEMDFEKGIDETKTRELLDRHAYYLNGFPDDDRNILIPLTDRSVAYELRGTAETGLTASFTAYGIPRYPTQLIESLGYLLIFALLYNMYQKGAWKKEGMLFGAFLLTVFGFRFLVEFLKVVQVDAEKGMNYNLGQSLSIPLVLAGIFFIVRALRKPAAA